MGITSHEVETAFDAIGFQFKNIPHQGSLYVDRLGENEGANAWVDLRTSRHGLVTASLILSLTPPSEYVADQILYLGTFVEVMGLDWKQTMDQMGTSLEQSFQPQSSPVETRQNNRRVFINHDQGLEMVVIVVVSDRPLK